MTQSLSDCCYRLPLAVPADENTNRNAGQPTFGCRLVGQLLAGQAGAVPAQPVGKDVCRACSQMFPPTPDDLNAVVASVLLTATEEALLDDSLSGEARTHLQAVAARAEASVPMLLPTDDDLPPLISSDELDLDHLLTQVPVPPRASGPSPVQSWAVGVTTAPRRQPTLSRCLRSLAEAGWSQPHLFVDGDVALDESAASLTRTVRHPAVGAWPNYLLSLQELLHRQPHADAVLMVQDDALFPCGPVRVYLEQALWFGETRAVASLYCCGDDQQSVDGWTRYEQQWRFGAVALVFTRDAAWDFLTSPEAARHSAGDPAMCSAGIDMVLGQWARRACVPIWRSTPSLVEHIGETSTIWETSRALGIRAAGRSLVSQRPGRA